MIETLNRPLGPGTAAAAWIAGALALAARALPRTSHAPRAAPHGIAPDRPAFADTHPVWKDIDDEPEPAHGA
ncbi:MAG TPA: hypothetical protein VFQ16_06655 [Burkholderiaceae bacterium]|nr:hypothetical protein [Burkholderiaceae bacterium]